MADGIYTADGRWLNFSDSQTLTDEFATRATRGEIFHWLGTLPDPDPILRKLYKDNSVFDDLMGDDQVTTAVMGRKVGTLGRDYTFRPGAMGDEPPTEFAQKVYDMLIADLENIDLFNLIAEILDAPFYGMVPIELLWRVEDGYYRLNNLQCRPAHWFEYNDKNEPRFMTLDGGTEGRTIPKAKFVFVRHFPTYKNPYGLRLLSRCFWPVTFKRGGRKFWAVYAEKFGMPWTIGKYPKGTSYADKREMLSNLMNMVQDAVAVIPQGGGVELIQSNGTSGANVHKELVEHMDAAISKVLQGQTLTSDVSKDGAAYSAGKVHAGTLEAYQGTDRKLVKSAMEEIAWIYTKLNMPDGVISPAFEWVEDEEAQGASATRDAELRRQGVKFNKGYYVREYNLRDDDFDMVDPMDAQQQGGMVFADAKPKRRFTPNQQSVEELVDNAAAKDGMHKIRSAIEQAVNASKDYDELMVRLAALLPELDADDFQEVLEQAVIAAESFGASIADSENE